MMCIESYRLVFEVEISDQHDDVDGQLYRLCNAPISNVTINYTPALGPGRAPPGPGQDPTRPWGQSGPLGHVP